MIKGLGIDAVDIARFIPWTQYPHSRLLRIFSADELDYCFAAQSNVPVTLEKLNRQTSRVIPAEAGIQAALHELRNNTIAQRLAVRFAAREAFFKTLSSLDSAHTVPFLTVCRYVAVEKQQSGAVVLRVDWESLCKTGLTIEEQKPFVHMSATHTASTAFVVVVIEVRD
jgi:phosphopantetheine--protein transferase-like protein